MRQQAPLTFLRSYILTLLRSSHALTFSRSHAITFCLYLSMTISEAISLIRPGIHPTSGRWADIGAGSGVFTQALMQLLDAGTVIALDKSPNALYKLKTVPPIKLDIVEEDFNHPLDLPLLDGILMANALHYAKDHVVVLKNVLKHLKPGGTFLFIEYDTDIPNDPWVPNPVSLHRFQLLCKEVGLSSPKVIGLRDSIYQDGQMYVARAQLT